MTIKTHKHPSNFWVAHWHLHRALSLTCPFKLIALLCSLIAPCTSSSKPVGSCNLHLFVILWLTPIFYARLWAPWGQICFVLICSPIRSLIPGKIHDIYWIFTASVGWMDGCIDRHLISETVVFDIIYAASKSACQLSWESPTSTVVGQNPAPMRRNVGSPCQLSLKGIPLSVCTGETWSEQPQKWPNIKLCRKSSSMGQKNLYGPMSWILWFHKTCCLYDESLTKTSLPYPSLGYYG